LLRREAAIVTDIPGTTRDLIEAPVAIEGVPFLLTDTAGLRDAIDTVESIGVGRARASAEAADVVLWLGDREEGPSSAVAIRSKADLYPDQGGERLAVSAKTGLGLDSLSRLLVERARSLLPQEGEVALNARHRLALTEALDVLGEASASDLLIAAESLRRARAALDRISGRAGVEDMLDALFGRFCIGK
jgi:tRNA modification GTPase